MAKAYYNSGLFAQSIPAYKRAAELDPANVTNRLYLAYAYAKTKQYGLAIDSYHLALSLDPKDAYAVKGLGEVYVEQNNLTMARKQYAALVPLNKDLANKLLIRINAANRPGSVVSGSK